VKFSAQLVFAVFVCGSIGCGWNHGRAENDRKAPGKPLRLDTAQQNDVAMRRLESVSWSPVRHRLTWDISRGEKKNEDFQAVKTDHYEILMDEATMTFNGETRRFSENEAIQVRAIMDVISKYAADSTVWWEEGEGEPVDGNSPARPRTREKPRKPADPDGVVSLPQALFQLADLGDRNLSGR
jgi:hypothetical protein